MVCLPGDVMEFDLQTLLVMKKQMIFKGNWKEVRRINKMIELRKKNA